MPPSGPFQPPGPYGAPPGYGYPGVAVAKAGFWARFAAYLIDAIIVGLFGIPARIALEAGSTKIEECSIDRSGNIDLGGEVNGLCEVPTATTWARPPPTQKCRSTPRATPRRSPSWPRSGSGPTS